jgi:hypothetical protein
MTHKPYVDNKIINLIKMSLCAKCGLLKNIKNWITNLQSLKPNMIFSTMTKNNFFVRKYENSQTSAKRHRKTTGVCL